MNTSPSPSRQLALAVGAADPTAFLGHEIGGALPDGARVTNLFVHSDTVLDEGDHSVAPLTIYFSAPTAERPQGAEAAVPGVVAFRRSDAGVDILSMRAERRAA